MVKNERCSKVLVCERNMPCLQLPLSLVIAVLFVNAKCSKLTGRVEQIIMTSNHLRSNVWMEKTWTKVRLLSKIQLP